ncbi:hypothetical protein ACM77G_02435 [Pseudomonas aeruginosa]|uniref:hypothetical protein n=1 Tax=Pseudomonas aeruginosa TaxID=287 RepID=UPI0018C79452|nr:hypothetical protein [Pseudomonas aeruginosa]MBG5872998.1 hypothetical protein [Pseudomonas aeruginosa]MBH3541054.1 hypothetical protein [Pseudomonas aeruginosa]MBI7511160.1 hypothetical protein [Pseudomonas aeruginosa]MBI7523178.1 hypothetical protein [Pseudomonas aeruginosa]MCY0280332.1 hypothetical protein [Pseudomonas aeruginosa]
MGQEGAEGKGASVIHVVDFSVHFAKIYDTAPANDQDFVDDFVEHVESNGLEGLPGRLKISWSIDSNDPQYSTKSQYAKKYQLWHYHVGIGKGGYDQARPYGDWTSQWILHLRRHECGQRTTIVDWDSHPPFTLPKLETLWVPGEEPF